MSESESPSLDAQDWNIVFQAYAEYPILAFILAQHLDTVKTFIREGREGRDRAVAGLDRAIDSLFPHTTFRNAGRSVYLLAVAGNLSPSDEQAMREIQEQLRTD